MTAEVMRERVRSLFLACAVGALLFAACSEDEDLPAPDAGAAVVADGAVSNDGAAGREGGVADAPLALDARADARGHDGGDRVGGMSGSGGAGGTSGAGGAPADPRCTSADSRGLFSSCSACSDPDNCDSVNGRAACGCASAGDCPCGFRCDCLNVAPQVRVCGICVK